MKNSLKKEDICALFGGYRHCSQIVISQWAEEFGMDEEQAIQLMAPFGGGCFQGEVCGAVSGAMAVIGLAYGHSVIGDEEGNIQMMGITAEFIERFKEKHGTIICRELLQDYDFSKDGDLERAMNDGVCFDICPTIVQDALTILEEII